MNGGSKHAVGAAALNRPQADMQDVWAVVPAYNEAGAIGTVIAGLHEKGVAVVVVDDGSSDGTARAAAAVGAAVVVHPVNLGQGAALQTGLEYALARGAHYLVTFDADGQHTPNDLARVLAPLQAGAADFTLGSRFLGSTVGAPPSRRLMLRAATAFTRLTTGLDLTDSHNGLRGMTRQGAACIGLRQNRMAHASEILEQIARSRLRYVEVPVTITYSAYSMAKGQKASDSIAILLDLAARYLQR
jgi:glycosyltransferase involved in cell wall biosynthesis